MYLRMVCRFTQIADRDKGATIWFLGGALGWN